MSSALIIITIFFLFSIYLAIRAKKGKTMDHEGWSVGGRSYGALLVFLLSAGKYIPRLLFLVEAAGLTVKDLQFYIP